MSTKVPDAQNVEHASDWQEPEIDWLRAVAPYVPKNISPCLPGQGADLIDVKPPQPQQGRLESWNEVQQRYESYAMCGMDFTARNPYLGMDDDTKLILGTLLLPQALVRGTCRRLFGECPELVTTWQLHAIAHALFNPCKNFWGKDSWSDCRRRAEVLCQRRAAVTQQVKELIKLGEAD